ncbi:MAG: hypothetical protein QW666_04050 [Candidatus Woesearchaeota archaeon]
MRKVVLFLAMFLLLASVASAANDLFVAKIEPKELTIREDQTAEYQLTLSHTSDDVKTFEIYSPNVIWDIMPAVPLRVEPYKQFATKLYIKPLNINPGVYSIPLHVKIAGTNLVDEKIVNLEITSLFPPDMTYLPAIRGSTTIENRIDPRDEVIVRVKLENQNRRELPKVDIKLRSKVINNDYTTSLGPFEKKELKFAIKLADHTPPQKDLLRVTLMVPEKEKAYQFDLLPAQFEVESFRGLDEKIEVIKSFLKTTFKITITNTGNIQLTEDYKKPTSFFKNIFLTSEPRAEKTNEYLIWKLNLESGQSQQIIYTFNFQPLFIIIVVILVLICAYRLFRNPVIMRKTAVIIATKEGGISELKIILEIMNRSKKPVKHLKIIDVVPRLAELIKEYDPGTMKPEQAIPHEHKGTILKWTIEHLEPGEERVLTYKIKSKLSILGGVKLPPAVSKCITSTGRERTSNSNAPAIGLVG